MRMGPSWIESARRKWLFTFCVTPATYLRCVCVCVCVCVRERERERARKEVGEDASQQTIR